MDNLFAMPVFLPYLRQQFQDGDVIVVSPDAGGMERARAYGKKLKTEIAMVDKRRPAPNVAEVMNIVGDVRDKVAVLCDDMIDTGGTLALAANALLENGAREVYSCCTHPVLSGPAVERISNSQLRKLVVTNTIPLDESAAACEKIHVLSLASLLGESIRRIQHEESLSSLFI